MAAPLVWATLLCCTPTTYEELFAALISNLYWSTAEAQSTPNQLGKAWFLCIPFSEANSKCRTRAAWRAGAAGSCICLLQRSFGLEDCASLPEMEPIKQEPIKRKPVNQKRTLEVKTSHAPFLALLLTTPVSILLLCGSLSNATVSGSSLLGFVSSHRPTVQLGVQVVANLLSFCQVLVVCRLINYAVRRRIASRSMSLNELSVWTDAMVPRVSWDVPIQYFAPLVAFTASSLALSAVWTAALTPFQKYTGVDATVDIPSWENTSFLREYPSEIGREGPIVQNAKGRFSYSVGTQFLGSLLADGAAATPIDGSPRLHAKMDNSGLTYIGRSYGMGSSAGLVDVSIRKDSLALGYSYLEAGYEADVICLYNASSDYTLEPAGDTWLYAAVGTLPDSDDGAEYSDYVGHNMDSIVAIGVAHFADPTTTGPLPLRKYLALATGSNYNFLNNIQCEINFVPQLFAVTVNLIGQNITVQPANLSNVEDIDPGRRLKGALMRQFALIAGDETNIYISTIGSALNASITSYGMFAASSDTTDRLTEKETSLRGVENSITAMTDDMLGYYAAAQLMVADFRSSTPVTVSKPALAIGELKYSAVVFALNAVVLLVVLVEFARTRAWKGLPGFNAADVRQLVVAASEGGSELAEVAFGREQKIGSIHLRYIGSGGGRFALVAGHGKTEEVPTVEHVAMMKAWQSPGYDGYD